MFAHLLVKSTQLIYNTSADTASTIYSNPTNPVSSIESCLWDDLPSRTVVARNFSNILVLYQLCYGLHKPHHTPRAISSFLPERRSRCCLQLVGPIGCWVGHNCHFWIRSYIQRQPAAIEQLSRTCGGPSQSHRRRERCHPGRATAPI